MNYERLQQLDKEKLIAMILNKDRQLKEFEGAANMEKFGKLFIDGRGYWIWGERI